MNKKYQWYWEYPEENRGGEVMSDFKINILHQKYKSNLNE